MKKNRGKIFLIIATIAMSIYSLYPTYVSNSFDKEISNLSGNDSLRYVEENEEAIREAKNSRLKIGLDLQGGMRVVLEVEISKLIEDMAKNKDDQFYSILNEVKEESKTSELSIIDLFTQNFQKNNLRLSRYYGSLRDENEVIVDKLNSESEKAIDRAIEIIRNRVDQYGVSEPSIQKQGSRRIIVELPGVSKENEVRQLLQGTALLEFKLMKDPEIVYKTMQVIDTYLAKNNSGTSDSTITTKSGKEKNSNTLESLTSNDTSAASLADKSPEQIRKEHPFLYLVRPNQEGTGDSYVSENDKEKVDRILSKEAIQQLIPSDMAFYWTSKQMFISEGIKYFGLLGLKKNAELTGAVVEDAKATIDPDFNQPIVTMEMNSEGSREWARITGANLKKRMAIVLDNAVFSAPVIQSKITGGRSQIEGMENIDEARLLEIILKAGALPAPVEIIEQRSVGPTLGEDSIKAGINSFILALIAVILFMIMYYRTGGFVANIALLTNILFIFAVLTAFKGTLTLPGIAGIVLSIGMAVDANVLIYERIREELASGKTLRVSIETGYTKAFSAIFDSNITTFFSGLILYQFGTGPIQGFALTLMMGVSANLFTAITITKVTFQTLLDRGTSKINFG
ncbi:MAG: protein translocase subunit SecD [Ignavibacteria bacterium]|nr:protein translocase subunit SecD [Bacteroidota bacterium]MSQ46548.1 protein translocase subunit SecD [Ignavibacteria bacterium]